MNVGGHDRARPDAHGQGGVRMNARGHEHGHGVAAHARGELAHDAHGHDDGGHVVRPPGIRNRGRLAEAEKKRLSRRAARELRYARGLASAREVKRFFLETRYVRRNQ